MSGAIAPIQKLTPDDHGPLVTVSCFVAIFTLVAFATSRFWITYRRKLRFQTDDASFILAMVFAISQSGCVIKQVDVGLGKHWSKLGPADKITFLKLGYAAPIIGTIAMAFAKVSLALLYQRIAPVGYEHVHLLLMFMVAGWTLFSIFSQAFGCKLPNPWLHLPSDCSTQFSLSYAIISLNFISDAILSTVFLPVLWKLNTNKVRRITAISLFASRLAVCLAAIAQLVVLIRMPKDSDPSWAMVPISIITQVVIYISVITACLPRIHHFLYNIQSGQIATTITNREIHSRRKEKAKDRSKSSNSSENKATNPFKSTKSTLFAPPTKVSNGRSNSNNSESSLFHHPEVQPHKYSHDTITDTSGVTLEDMPMQAARLFRPPGEPLNTYNTRCFSDAPPPGAGGPVSRQGPDGKDDSWSTSSSKKNVMYETREFQIEFPHPSGSGHK